MKAQVQCPLCAQIVIKSLDDKDSDVITIRCVCGKSLYRSDLGWLISFTLIAKLKEDIFSREPHLYQNFYKLASQFIPDMIANLDVSLDTSIVKLYCSNEKCGEKGFITRTKVFAEKNMHFCGVCNSVMKW